MEVIFCKFREEDIGEVECLGFSYLYVQNETMYNVLDHVPNVENGVFLLSGV